MNKKRPYPILSVAPSVGASNIWIFFSFFPEAKLISSLYVHITLATDTEAESPCFPKHVEIQYSKSFLTSYFLKQNDQRSSYSGDLSHLNSLDLQAIFHNFNFTGKTVPFPSTDTTFFIRFLLRKVSSSFFLSPILIKL